MNVTLDQFEAVAAIARLGSFTKAATILHLSQPALTVRILHLEEALGVRLFDRSNRLVKMTSIGERLIPLFEHVLQEIKAVLAKSKDFSTLLKGTVTIGALPSISSKFLPTTISEFQKQYPGIEVSLRDVLAQRVVRLVKEEEVDFGIGTLISPEQNIQFTPLFTDHLGVIFPEGHPVERQRTITLKYLATFPLILMVSGTSVRNMVDRAFESIGEVIVPAFETVHMSTAVAMVRAGLGLTIEPSSAMELASFKGLKFRAIRYKGFIRQIGIIRNAQRSLSPSAKIFIDMLKGLAKTLNP